VGQRDLPVTHNNLMKAQILMNVKLFAAAAGFAAMLSAGSAMAAWPPSVLGVWSALGNQSPLQLDIVTQGNVGDCRAITGTIADTLPGGQSNTIQGFYCPRSGRIQFLRKSVTTNDTFQVYTGNVSMVGTTLYMGGTFAEDDQIGALGEYNFSAQQ
jgi:hypothetical protein